MSDSGPKSEVGPLERHVRSTLNSRRRRTAPACPVRARNGSRASFNYLVSAGKNSIGNTQPKRHCRFQVQGKFESNRLFDRKFGWTGSLEDFVDVLRSFAKHRRQRGAVAG